MKKPKCKLCGSPHWTYEPHAINKERLTDAINIERADSATGGQAVVAAAVDAGRLAEVKRTGHNGRSVNSKTPNRRSRAAYNSYMKDYMRAYRERSR